jgi:hypothetical protein
MRIDRFSPLETMRLAWQKFLGLLCRAAQRYRGMYRAHLKPERQPAKHHYIWSVYKCSGLSYDAIDPSRRLTRSIYRRQQRSIPHGRGAIVYALLRPKPTRRRASLRSVVGLLIEIGSTYNNGCLCPGGSGTRMWACLPPPSRCLFPCDCSWLDTRPCCARGRHLRPAAVVGIVAGCASRYFSPS